MEKLCAELRRQIDEEIKKQKMSSESLLEELVNFVVNLEKIVIEKNKGSLRLTEKGKKCN